MAQTKQGDKFANKFYGTVLETAANTLTFAEIPTNVDVFAKQAWVLHKLEWYVVAGDVIRILDSNDSIRMALTSSNKMDAIGLNDAGVVDLLELGLHMITSGATLYTRPFIRDFTSLPGGGLIIAPRPLYIAAQGVSLAAAITAEVRGYFTAMTLNADEYLELVDFYRIIQ